ncbi:hypothetical protein EDB84DRAFT_1618436 [Lactarius hengduanensis]|nr:hypothetical protein EDB84DRAFT_1618436 [Lactarius hengduanensis]
MGTSSISTRLPIEVLTTIFKEVDDVRDLCHVRTACHTFCAVATPFAFRVLSVIATGGSSKNLGQLLDVPDIAAHVREIAYRDTGADRKGRMLKHSASFLSPYRPINEITTLSLSFSRIHQLSRLETIKLTFYPLYDNRLSFDGQSRLAVQASILGALTASFSVRAPPGLTSLSLDNLRIWELSPLESPSFQTVLTTLRRLLLSVLSDRAPDAVAFDARWCHFWGTLCPRMILAPTQHTLTDLTLHSDAPVGALSGLSLAGLHFPLLCALSIRGLVFEPSIGVEPFVLRHVATLVQLEVLACKLPNPVDLSLTSFQSLSTALSRDESGPDGWDRIWDRFAAELTALVTLNVDLECRYVELVFLWEAYVSELRYAADAAALRRFHMTVTSRSGEMRDES